MEGKTNDSPPSSHYKLVDIGDYSVRSTLNMVVHDVVIENHSPILTDFADRQLGVLLYAAVVVSRVYVDEIEMVVWEPAQSFPAHPFLDEDLLAILCESVSVVLDVGSMSEDRTRRSPGDLWLLVQSKAVDCDKPPRIEALNDQLREISECHSDLDNCCPRRRY